MPKVYETPPEQQAPPLIAAAAKVILQHGWVRGELCTENGYCIVGAIIATGATEEVQDIAFDFIRSECNSKIVSKWNDLTAKNKKEVVRMLERAARRAREALYPKERRAGPERGSIYSPECFNA